MIKNGLRKFLIICSIPLIIIVLSFSIYPVYIALQNNSMYLEKYYFEEDVELENLKINKTVYDGIPLTLIEADFEGNHYNAFARVPENPKHVAVLFAGSRTGQKAMRYLTGVFEDSIIIAMGYPFEDKKYSTIETVKTLIKARRGLFNVSRVSREFVSIIARTTPEPLPPLISVGVSFGVPFAYQLAGIDKRVKNIVYCYGFSNLGGMLDNILKYHFNKRNLDLQFIRSTAGWLLDIFLYPLEPDNWVKYNRSTPILFIRGKNDKSIPPQYILPFIVSHDNKHEVVFEGDHFDKKNLKRILEISEIVSKWLDDIKNDQKHGI